MRYEIKELSVGGILDQAIKLVKNHFVLLLSITCVMMAPLAIVAGLVTPTPAPFDPENPQAGQDLEALMAGGLGMVAIVLIVNLLFVYPLTNAAIIHAIASEYLEKPTTVGAAFRRGWSVLIPLILTVALTYLAIFGGMLLCFIPGIIFSFLFALTTHVAVIEGTYGMAALRRSRQLMKGNIGTFFVLGFVLLIIQFGLAFLSQLIPQKQLSAVASGLEQSLVFIVGSAVWVVFYFSCRCKAENFDLLVLADAVGRDDPTPGATLESGG